MAENFSLLPKAKLNEYKSYLENSLPYKSWKMVVGSSLEHRYIMRSQMLSQAKINASFLIENFVPLLENESYLRYLEELRNASVYRRLEINFLLLEDPVETREFDLLKELHSNADELICVKLVSKEAKNLILNGQNQNEDYEARIFEIFDKTALRVEYLDSSFCAIGSFQCPKHAQKYNEFFELAFKSSLKIL